MTDHHEHSDHSDHDHAVTLVGVPGEFRNGPLDGLGFMFWVPPDLDLADMRVTMPRNDGLRDVYLFDAQPNPASLEAGFRHIGRMLA